MKKLIVLGLLALGAQPALAATLTVNLEDVLNKINEASVREVTLREGNSLILTDARGISVYTFDADSDNVSNCRGGCLKEWPPVRVNANQALPAPFGRITGNDGKPQLTILNQPLYYYHDDEAEGDVFGDYTGWHPVKVTE